MSDGTAASRGGPAVPAGRLLGAARLAGVLLALGAASAAAEEPGAYELLERVRRAYGALENYRDRGEVERDAGGRRSYLAFSTARAGERFLFELRAETPAGTARRSVWSNGRESLSYDSLRGQLKAVESAAAEVAATLGRGGFEALVAPMLLAGSDSALADPEAASLDGEEACGEATCYRLTCAHMGGEVEVTLWIERESLLLRRVEALLHAPPGGERLELRVEHGPPSIGTGVPEAALALSTPPATRRVERWEAPEATPGTAGHGAPSFSDEITVDLLRLTVRAVDRRGEAIPGLGPEDFRLRVGGEEVPVLSADWVAPESGDGPRATVSDPAAAWRRARAGSAEPPGRIVVFFVQSDVNAVRIEGHLRMLDFVGELVAALGPGDLAAVAGFDSHLKLWRDLGAEKPALEAALERAARFGGLSPLERPGRPPSLGRHLPLEARRDAATPEQALLALGRALAELPGEKAVVYFGWGLGRYSSSGLRHTPDYRPALEALRAARAAVFVLDVTDADHHTLELTLAEVAEATGGTYAKTNRFAAQATRRLARTLAGGHYVLTVDRASLPPGGGRQQVTLRGDGTALVRRAVYE